MKQRPRGRELFKKYIFFLNALSKFYCLFPKSIRKSLLVLHRDTAGKIGMGIRYALLNSLAKNVGINVGVYQHVVLLNVDDMKIGDNVSIHPFCYIDGSGGIDIGNDVSIAHGVSLISFEHRYERLDIPIKDQALKKKKIIINDGVWIGAKSTILSGSVLESGCIVGANSLVKGIVAENSIVAGVPATAIKSRDLSS